MMKEKKSSYFITGIISMIPIVMTLYIIKVIFDMGMGVVKSFIPIDIIIEVLKNLLNVPEKLMVEIIITVLIYGITLLFIYIFIMLTGVIVKHIIDIEKARYIEKIFLRIPLIKPIYSTIKQIMEMITTNSGEAYKSVVMVEYPKQGIYSIGFLTNNNLGKIKNNFEKKDMINVFIPTAPNPTTGFLIIIEKDKVTELDIKVDEALKMIVSAGVIVPKSDNIQLEEDKK